MLQFTHLYSSFFFFFVKCVKGRYYLPVYGYEVFTVKALKAMCQIIIVVIITMFHGNVCFFCDLFYLTLLMHIMNILTQQIIWLSLFKSDNVFTFISSHFFAKDIK